MHFNIPCIFQDFRAFYSRWIIKFWLWHLAFKQIIRDHKLFSIFLLFKRENMGYLGILWSIIVRGVYLSQIIWLITGSQPKIIRSYCIPHTGFTIATDQCLNSYKTCRPGVYFIIACNFHFFLIKCVMTS